MNPKDKKLLSFYLMNRLIFLRMKLYFPSNETLFSLEGNFIFLRKENNSRQGFAPTRKGRNPAEYSV